MPTIDHVKLLGFCKQLLRKGGIFAEYYRTQFAPEEKRPELSVLA